MKKKKKDTKYSDCIQTEPFIPYNNYFCEFGMINNPVACRRIRAGARGQGTPLPSHFEKKPGDEIVFLY